MFTFLLNINQTHQQMHSLEKISKSMFKDKSSQQLQFSEEYKMDSIYLEERRFLGVRMETRFGAPCYVVQPVVRGQVEYTYPIKYIDPIKYIIYSKTILSIL